MKQIQFFDGATAIGTDTTAPYSLIYAPSGAGAHNITAQATDNNGKDFYWTSRLADIVAEYSVLEPKWKAKQSEQDRREQEEQQRRVREKLHQEQVQQEIERSRNSILDSAKELLGSNNNVRVDSNGYGLDTHAVVTFTLKEFEKLIELAYAGQE